MLVNPRIERRLRLFDQHDPRQTRRAAASTVNSRAISSNDAGSVSTTSCCSSGSLGNRSFQHAANVRQIAAAGFDRRDPLDVARRMPRQQLRRAIDARMAEPGLGRGDQSTRRRRAIVAGHEADHMRGRRLACRGRRLIVKPRQRIAGFDLPRRDKLRNLQHAHLPRLLRRIDIADGRVRRAQVDADDIAAGQRLRASQLGIHGYSMLPHPSAR